MTLDQIQSLELMELKEQVSGGNTGTPSQVVLACIGNF